MMKKNPKEPQDQVTFVLDEETFQWFFEQLEAPPKDKKKLARLMASTPPWPEAENPKRCKKRK